jgi:hypothetical protein
VVSDDLVTTEVEKANTHSVRALVVVTFLSALRDSEGRDVPLRVNLELWLKSVHAGSF